MSDTYANLKHEIDETFFEIVGIINEVIQHRTESFSDMMDISETIQKGSEVFVSETDHIISDISDDINEKVQNLNMDQMKADIKDATVTFIAITEELELLSYNTICRTMALGEKGATITHISKEIKKYSTSVKDLLEVISKSFGEMFEKFKEVSDHLVRNRILPEENSFSVNAIGSFALSSDVSALIKDSQFHDIYSQELEIIKDGISNINYSSNYEAGIIFGVYEKAMGKLDVIKYSIQDKLEEIKYIMGDFLYSFNTDMQNIVSKTNILRSELNRVHEISEKVCGNIKDMTGSIDGTKRVISSTRGSVAALGKQSKTFRNLVVITAVEVARINDESLRSVVVSMNQTEDELNKLIDKLNTNVDMWEELRSSFMSAFLGAQASMDQLCSSSVAERREYVLKSTHDLDISLDDFRKIFLADKYMGYFDQNTNKLMNLFADFNESVQENFMEFNNSLGDETLSDEEFTRGRNEAELKDIIPDESEQSSVEFF